MKHYLFVIVLMMGCTSSSDTTVTEIDGCKHINTIDELEHRVEIIRC